MCMLVTQSTGIMARKSQRTSRRYFHLTPSSQRLGAIFIPCLLREPGYESLRVGPQEPAQRPKGPEPSAEGGEEAPHKETAELVSKAARVAFIPLSN